MPDMKEIPAGDEQDQGVTPVDGQCGTCGWAVGFDYAGCPSGPEDEVKCASADHARELDNLSQNDLATEFRTQGYMNLMRLEVLAEEDFRCAYWQPKKGKEVKQY